VAVSLITIIYISASSIEQTRSEKYPAQNQSGKARLEITDGKVIKIPYGAGKPGLRSIFFEPSRIFIHKGDTVEWENNDAVSHTATSSFFNSGLIWPANSSYGKSSFKKVFDRSGVFAYFCEIHPYMSGAIYVDAQENERVLKNPATNVVDVKIEIPQNTAYQSNYGPYFIPAYGIVPAGSKITWTNKDYIPHTATATDGSFDTEAIKPGQSETIRLNHNSGTLAYYCEIHPWMQATIQVFDNKFKSNF
jgi:plastocyanin